MMACSSFRIVAAVASMLSAAITTGEALQVVAPSEGMTVVADRPYSVGWTGADIDARFEIDLHYCGSYSFCSDEEEDCGFYIASLYSEGDAWCTDQQEGGCDIVMPEPISGHSGYGYRLRIAEIGTEQHRCSEDFYLMASADAPMTGEEGGPEIAVVAPTEGSTAFAGETYTVEFDYDNGYGERIGRFKIDLYMAEGSGDCGEWVTSICDKPDMGCHDTQGDYDVVIPEDTPTGMYKIRVGLFGEDSTFACSQAFGVVPLGDPLWV